MIPLSLITGFLGSGKTTLLKRIIKQNKHKRMAYLVNELSANDVDGQLLASQTDDVTALPGGSIFCRCLLSEFVRVLTALPEQYSTLDGVVIEASGIANPKVVEQMLSDTKLDAIYQLTSVVAVTDPASFPILVQTLPNIAAQVESSDWVILNKVDQFEQDVVDQTKQAIRAIKADANILPASFCEVDLDLFDPRKPQGLTGAYAKCKDPNYASVHLPLDKAVNIDHLLSEIKRQRQWVYRVKGFVPTPDGSYYLDYSTGGATAHPCDTPVKKHGLTFIVNGHEPERLNPLVAAVQAA